MRTLSFIAVLLSTSASAEVVNPTVAYELPPGFSDAVIPNGFPVRISVRGLGAEDSGSSLVQNCAFSGPNATAFSVSPSQIVLTASAQSAFLDVRCTTASFETVNMQCVESANPGNGEVGTTRSWTFSCSNLIIDRLAAPIFAPNLGTIVRLNGPANLGASASSNIELRLRPGFIIGPITVSGCQISGTNAAAFGAAPTDVSLQPASNLTLPLSCTRAAGAQTASLACTQTIGTNSTPISWQILCPGVEQALFKNGFEPELR
jgi:hypothetical protein